MAGVRATADSVPLSEKPFSCFFCYLLLVRNVDIEIYILDTFLKKSNIYSTAKCHILGNEEISYICVTDFISKNLDFFKSLDMFQKHVEWLI